MTEPTLVRSDWDARIWIDGVGEAERRLEVTPAIAGWASLSVRSYTFRAGQVIEGESAADEMSMVLLTGRVTIEIDGPSGPQSWELAGRDSVFASSPPFAIYLPPGHTYKTTVHADADCCYGRAPAAGTRQPRTVTPLDATTSLDAHGNQVRRLFDQSITEHLVCEETIIEPARWAGSNRTPAGASEHVLYIRAEPDDGWGLIRLTRGDHETTLTVRNGDAVIVRGEDHHLVASPGTKLYLLRFAARR